MVGQAGTNQRSNSSLTLAFSCTMRRVKQDTSSMPPCGFIASVCAAGLHIVHSVAPLQCCYCCWEHVSAQHSTAQHSTAQHSTSQHSTAQHSTAQHSTAQHSTAQHSTAQHSTAQHSTAQHSTQRLPEAASLLYALKLYLHHLIRLIIYSTLTVSFRGTF